MKTLIAIISLLIICSGHSDDSVVYNIGKPLTEAQKKQINKLSSMGGSGDILTAEDRSKTYIWCREYVSEDGKFSITIRTRFSSRHPKDIITGIIYSNKGVRRKELLKRGEKWITSKSVVVTAKPWTATKK